MVGAEAVDLALLERIAQKRRFEERTLEIAKRHFVYGESVPRLAAEYGLHVQRVYAIRRMVLETAQQIALPPGWEEVTIAGPRELVARFKRLFEEALARHGAEGAQG
ncbi:MAG: hypothetical protein JSR59_21625 [Proteobacteria bacterium]|nr:hypothetical protein [Pseudomonadota bacterium]